MANTPEPESIDLPIPANEDEQLFLRAVPTVLGKEQNYDAVNDADRALNRGAWSRMRRSFREAMRKVFEENQPPLARTFGEFDVWMLVQKVLWGHSGLTVFGRQEGQENAT